MTLASASELTVEQYQLLASLLPPAHATGRPRRVNLMQVMQAILCVLARLCLALVAQNRPALPTVYYYFRQWRDDGSGKRIHDQLVVWVRLDHEREPSPSAASLDSQSVPSAVMVDEAVGYDAAKKIKGRKRLTIVDTLGWLIAVRVVAANTPEREGAKQLLTPLQQERARVPRLVRIWVDGGFSGKDCWMWVMKTRRWIIEVVLRPENAKGNAIAAQTQRQSIAPTAGCIGVAVSMSMCERLPASSEAFIHVATIRLMLRRLA